MAADACHVEGFKMWGRRILNKDELLDRTREKLENTGAKRN
jgi:hypothetical protein